MRIQTPSTERSVNRLRGSGLSEEVVAYVRDLILSGQLREGEFVRLERLAEDLQMSATPVREGLVALRGAGLLHLEPRRGFVVSPLSSEDIADIFWVQATIAGELAARAAAKINEEQFEVLVEAQNKLSDAAARNAPEEIEIFNFEFHRYLNAIGGAAKLQGMLRSTMQYVPRRFFATISGWPHASVSDHRSILNALHAKDQDLARQTMTNHIVHAGVLLSAHRRRVGRSGDESEE
jgi:DNA-binding GntR family transcriptional regulator